VFRESRLKGKELGVGITQQKDGLYNAGFVDKLGKRRVKRFKKLQECRKWLEDAKFIDEHSSITEANNMMVDAFFEILDFNQGENGSS
jgi:hypothetical protein